MLLINKFLICMYFYFEVFFLFFWTGVKAARLPSHEQDVPFPDSYRLLVPPVVHLSYPGLSRVSDHHCPSGCSHLQGGGGREVGGSNWCKHEVPTHYPLSGIVSVTHTCHSHHTWHNKSSSSSFFSILLPVVYHFHFVFITFY